MNISIAIDNEMARHWKPLAPHKNVFVLNAPREISDNISIPKPDIATFSYWLKNAQNRLVDPEKLGRFMLLQDA